ncbi:hypothetical protein EC957_001286 [Mortierella hygrophila]|uniref:Uncharacterized protein n=1 Tax=Mortierella hygrophila TaxID=979708 RepID=A0A9P6K2Q9_9FUNG|nr:hypothetical protein EC957_001286 [Mortierella hygrophila]
MTISEIIAEAMFKPSNSSPPKKPAPQSRQQQLQQQQYPRSSKICCLSLHDTNKIRLINAPLSLISPLRLAIFETWNQPIQHETSLPQCGGHEFKLKGKPWGPPGKNGPLLDSTNLILAMLMVLEIRGWSLIMASNVSHLRDEKDSLFFEWVGLRDLLSSRERDLDEQTLVDPSEHQIDDRGKEMKGKWDGDVEGDVELFTVELLGYDMIRVTGAPVAVLTAVRLAILRHWTQGIEKEDAKKGAYEFKMEGFPFRTWGSETSIERSMMLIQALENMRLHGFELCSLMDLDVVGKGKQEKHEKQQKKGRNDGRDKQIVDSWVLRRGNSGRRKDELRQSRLGGDSRGEDERDGWVVRL